MVRWTVPVLWILLLGCGVWLFLSVFCADLEDRAEYAVLLYSSDPKKDLSVDVQAAQERKKVRKEAWIPQEEGRSHLLLLSDSSHQVLSFGPTESDAVEYLDEAQCWYQSRLAYDDAGQPTQEERYFKAFSATYSLRSNLFTAKTVDFLDYKLPGHELIQDLSSYSPRVEGTAHHVEFTFVNARPQFHAETLRAKLLQDPSLDHLPSPFSSTSEATSGTPPAKEEDLSCL